MPIRSKVMLRAGAGHRRQLEVAALQDRMRRTLPKVDDDTSCWLLRLQFGGRR